MTNKFGRFTEWLSAVFSRTPAVVALSVVSAVIIWFIIVVNVYPQTPQRFYNIPLDAAVTGTNAEAAGLSVVDIDVESVNVELVGDRSQIGRLTSEDLTAYIEADTVTVPGEYTLSIGVRTDTGISFKVDSVTPATATVRFDKIETRLFPVSPVYPNIVVTSGHAMDAEEVVCEPAEIEITGPAAQLDEIDHVEAYYGKNQEIDSSFSFYTIEVRLYTDDGALLDTEDLEIADTSFQISLPVLTTKELALTYTVTGARSGFDLDWLKERLTLSEDTITLASQTSTNLSEVDNWSVGEVRLADIAPGYTKNFNLEFADDLINRSGIGSVTMTFDDTDVGTKTFTVTGDNINIANAPSNYEFKTVTKRMDVTIAGPVTELEKLDVDDIIVTVDLLNYNVEQSTSFSWTPVITFYRQNEDEKYRFWATGSYLVAVDRVEDTTASSDE